MAPLILVEELSADLERLDNRLSQAKTSVKSLLVLKEPAIILAALVDLTDSLRSIQEDSMRSRVRTNMAIEKLIGGRK